MFEKIVKELNLGNLITNPSRVYGGLTHRMYSVETDKGHYVVKILNKNIMKRSSALDNFKRADSLEKVLEENNIPCIYSIDNSIKKIDDNYYYVYDYYDGKVLNQNEITVFKVKEIGKVMANIHNIDIKKGFDTTPTKNINFKKYIELSKESEIYDYLKDNIDLLNESLIKGNESTKKVPIISCICHNDMDIKNVLWNKNDFKIIDLECLCYANPYLEMFETALCWSGYEKCSINFELFKEFIKAYKDNTNLDMNIDWEQIYYLNNGRLSWLEYNIKRALNIECLDKEEQELGIKEVKETIKHAIYYNSIKDKILEAINEVLLGGNKYEFIRKK